VGKDLEEIYWRPGNGAAFLELVQQLTAEPLSADAWVSRLYKQAQRSSQVSTLLLGHAFMKHQIQAFILTLPQQERMCLVNLSRV